MKKTAVLLLCLSGYGLFAQKLNHFSLMNVTDGKTVSLENYSSAKGLIIIFTSNRCPYDEYYRNRIANLASSYSNSFPLILVNAHTEPEESNESMAEKARQWNLNIPYLADKDQTLLRTLDARKSPEAFLLKNDKGTFTVVYRGAIDDNPQVEADVRNHYLKNVITSLLNNQPVSETGARPVGCNIRRKSSEP